MQNWTNDTHHFLETVSTVAAVKFVDISGMLAVEHMGIRHESQGSYGVLGRRIKNLQDIIEKSDAYLG